MTDLEPLNESHERVRLEASALVASKVSRDVSHRVVKKAQIKTMIREAVIVLLVIVVAILAYRNFGESQRTSRAIIIANQINCKQYRDVADLPLATNTGTVGFGLIADFRNSYYAFKCQVKNGELRKPDPKLIPYLDQDAKGGVGDPLPETQAPAN